MFWTPAFAGVTIQETFYEIIKFILFIILKSGLFCQEQNMTDP